MIKIPKVCQDSIPKSSATIIGVVFIIATVMISIYSYQISYFNGREKHLSTKGYISPSINGDITYEEWRRSSLYMYPQWIMFENKSIGTNNWNYLCVGFDDYNLYICIDMISINQTLPSEILKVYLILNDDYFATSSEYAILEDWGVESLIYDISSQSISTNDEDGRNTILNSNVQSDYSSSLNSDTIHRSVEISISIDEMRYFDTNSEIGILIVGSYDGGSYYFAASSPNSVISYYDSSCYLGVDLGDNEEIYV